jgi:hypothetical protein
MERQAGKMKLYFWGETVLALAGSIEEAKLLILERVRFNKKFADALDEREPTIVDTPCAHIIMGPVSHAQRACKSSR